MSEGDNDQYPFGSSQLSSFTKAFRVKRPSESGNAAPTDTEEFMGFACSVLAEHEDIAHIQITITHKDGSKTDYMEGPPLVPPDVSGVDFSRTAAWTMDEIAERGDAGSAGVNARQVQASLRVKHPNCTVVSREPAMVEYGRRFETFDAGWRFDAFPADDAMQSAEGWGGISKIVESGQTAVHSSDNPLHVGLGRDHSGVYHTREPKR